MKTSNPKPFLVSLIDKDVVIRLKWNKTEYKGKLKSVDNYMNFRLNEAYESVLEGGERIEEQIGDVFIRCNNVLFVRELQ